jgi:deoxyribodipyrimidine photo-lyase
LNDAKPLLTENIQKQITRNTTLCWLRRDLRLTDNAALYHALVKNENVLAVFIFDSIILDKLENKADKRVEFIYQTLSALKGQLEQLGSSLLVLYENPVDIFQNLAPKVVFANDDYEPYARMRDRKVREMLEHNGSQLLTTKDHVIFEKDEVVKDDGTPYTVFTPYCRKWKSKLSKFYLRSYPTEKYFKGLLHTTPFPFPALKEIGFQKTGAFFPDRVIRQSIIGDYDKQRDFPAVNGTTRLSLHLRFGTVSIRTLARLALDKTEVWLNELIWRDFYQMILWHFPQVETKAFKEPYDRIVWRNDVSEFSAWCEGRTGYPIVDAGMRELNSTGFMHNRVRMIVASFLTKHLLIDWRWGEAYFAEKLLDFDLAANNGGWQWAAGSGCDAAPYFRVFNPALQTEKFDPQFEYIRKWVPELGTESYPRPIVDHAWARERALRAYKKALDVKTAEGV